MKLLISLTLLSAVAGFGNFHDGHTCAEMKKEEDCYDMTGCTFDAEFGCTVNLFPTGGDVDETAGGENYGTDGEDDTEPPDTSNGGEFGPP